MSIGRRQEKTSSILFLFGFLGFLAFAFGLCDVTAAPNRRPNVIFILADDLGYGDVGCYGQTRIRTPNLDKLAADGMRFTQFYAGTTVCAPSRAVLMTGRHSGHVSIRGNALVPLATNETTLAEVLKGSGYFTGCFGKWGLGRENTGATPMKRGFDEWYGYLDQTHAHNYYPTQLWRSSTAAGVADTALNVDGNANGAKGTYSHDLFTKAAQNFVRIGHWEPFFMYLAYTIPHANNELKAHGMEVPSVEPYANEAWPEPEKAKAAMITRMDRDIGTILEQLRHYKIESNTVVFFSSDNGPHREGGVDSKFFNSAGPLRGIKRDMYEGGIRVPLIVRWPGHVPAGKVSDQVWAFWDILPTVAELTGAKTPSGIDGLSFAPTLLGRPQEKTHEFLYWEFHEGGSKQAARSGDWKVIRPGPGQALELYDLKADLGETNNVASSHAEVVARFENYLKTARTESAEWPMRTEAEEKAANRALTDKKKPGDPSP